MNERIKITASHLSRQSVVYLRQSSAAQVEHNRESTERQYALAAKAVDLGWSVEGCGHRAASRSGIQCWPSGKRTISPSSASLTLSWQDRREFGCASAAKLSMLASCEPGTGIPVTPSHS